MTIRGFKAFNFDKTNRYGMVFSEGETYTVDGEVKFGVRGNGFHMCMHLCDVFRYFSNDEGIAVAEVIGNGKLADYNEPYFGYYDMYAVSELTIVRFLKREEIINKMLEDCDFNVKKFIMTFTLSEDEKVLFLRKFRRNIDILCSILYYQYGIKDIYYLENDDKKEKIRMVLAYGQNNNKGC